MCGIAGILGDGWKTKDLAAMVYAQWKSPHGGQFGRFVIDIFQETSDG